MKKALLAIFSIIFLGSLVFLASTLLTWQSQTSDWSNNALGGGYWLHPANKHVARVYSQEFYHAAVTGTEEKTTSPSGYVAKLKDAADGPTFGTEYEVQLPRFIDPKWVFQVHQVTDPDATEFTSDTVSLSASDALDELKVGGGLVVMTVNTPVLSDIPRYISSLSLY